MFLKPHMKHLLSLVRLFLLELNSCLSGILIWGKYFSITAFDTIAKHDGQTNSDFN